MAELPVVTFKRKKYFVDLRLDELRNVKNPHEVIKTRDLGMFELAKISEQLNKKKKGMGKPSRCGPQR